MYPFPKVIKDEWHFVVGQKKSHLVQQLDGLYWDKSGLSNHLIAARGDGRKGRAGESAEETSHGTNCSQSSLYGKGRILCQVLHQLENMLVETAYPGLLEAPALTHATTVCCVLLPLEGDKGFFAPFLYTRLVDSGSNERPVSSMLKMCHGFADRDALTCLQASQSTC